jgi:hypothetical protein
MHPGLLYPDGYQYLLMARGIGEHLQPVVTLGPGGDTLAPSSEAAAKPLFPALVALLQAAGFSPLGAARLVTAAVAAAVPMLAGLVALRLGASRSGALLAALLCLVSPAAVYWAGFPGPDPLAQTLALGAALALLARRPTAGGVLAGLCVLARPEYAVPLVAACLAAALCRQARRNAFQAATSALLVVGVTFAVLRPPLPVPSAGEAAGAALLVAAVAGLLLVSGRGGALYGIAAAAVLVALLPTLASGGFAWLARHNWPLVALACAGAALAARSRRDRTIVLRLAALALPLALVYWWKNPGSERYAAQLVPALAIAAGLGLGRLRWPVLVLAGAAAVAAALLQAVPRSGSDSFRALAPALARAPTGALVTAAPDAYGILLPDRPIRVMRPGAEGLVLLDAAARAYEPDLTVSGTLLARLPAPAGFVRPDGRVDRAPALLYRGRVVER